MSMVTEHIARIEKTRSADDVQFTFFAVIATAEGEKRANISPSAILDYGAMQWEMLVQTGILFTVADCEGRLPADANTRWRSLAAALLNIPAQPVQPNVSTILH